MSENNSQNWKCPLCGEAGNTGSFCRSCGAVKPGAPVGGGTNASAAPQPSYYANAPYGSNAGSPVPTPPTYTYTEEISREDNRKADRLCIISLICMFGLPMVFSFITSMIMQTTLRSVDPSEGYRDQVDGLSAIMGGLTIITSLSLLAALILMIVVRVKYPKNTFGKVLMWIYIAGAVLSLIVAIIVIATIVSFCSGEWADFWKSCNRMGVFIPVTAW